MRRLSWIRQKHSVEAQESLKVEEEDRRVVRRDAPGEAALKIQSERGLNPPFASLEDEGRGYEARNEETSRS